MSWFNYTNYIFGSQCNMAQIITQKRAFQPRKLHCLLRKARAWMGKRERKNILCLDRKPSEAWPVTSKEGDWLFHRQPSLIGCRKLKQSFLKVNFLVVCIQAEAYFLSPKCSGYTSKVHSVLSYIICKLFIWYIQFCEFFQSFLTKLLDKLRHYFFLIYSGTTSMAYNTDFPMLIICKIVMRYHKSKVSKKILV